MPFFSSTSITTRMSPLIEVDPKSSWKCPDWTPRNPLVNLRGVVSLQYLLKTAEGGFHTFIYTTPLPNIPHIYIWRNKRSRLKTKLYSKSHKKDCNRDSNVHLIPSIKMGLTINIPHFDCLPQIYNWVSPPACHPVFVCCFFN